MLARADDHGENEVAAGVTRFLKVDYPEPHRERAQAIIRNHPEVRSLFGRNPWTAAILTGVVALQIGVAVLLRSAPWWQVIVVAWALGAFASHALWVIIHECAHNLILRRKAANQWLAILANVPLVIPSAASFCVYHLRHHKHQGDLELDADLASNWEARLIGHGFFGKLAWECLFPVFQTLRAPRFSRSGKIPFVTPWLMANIAICFAFDVALWYVAGPTAVAYLLTSLLFSIGPHPLGARWVQEHFLVAPPQETYSYYGPLNTLALNVGYHNEHHDFPFIAWDRLPELKALAPEMYDPLVSHRSWARLWLRFLLDPRLSLYSRVTRDGQTHERRPAAFA